MDALRATDWDAIEEVPITQRPAPRRLAICAQKPLTLSLALPTPRGGMARFAGPDADDCVGVPLAVEVQHLLTLLFCHLGHTFGECERLRAAKCFKISGIVIEPRQAGFGVVGRGRRLCR